MAATAQVNPFGTADAPVRTHALLLASHVSAQCKHIAISKPAYYQAFALLLSEFWVTLGA